MLGTSNNYRHVEVWVSYDSRNRYRGIIIFWRRSQISLGSKSRGNIWIFHSCPVDRICEHVIIIHVQKFSRFVTTCECGFAPHWPAGGAYVKLIFQLSPPIGGYNGLRIVDRSFPLQTIIYDVRILLPFISRCQDATNDWRTVGDGIFSCILPAIVYHSYQSIGTQTHNT